MPRWIIEKDYIDGTAPRDLVGREAPEYPHYAPTTGTLKPGNVTPLIVRTPILTQEDAPVTDESHPYRFIVADDDGNVYFEGRASDHVFGPLDFVGESYGCTMIAYLDNRTGKWELL